MNRDGRSDDVDNVTRQDLRCPICGIARIDMNDLLHHRVRCIVRWSARVDELLRVRRERRQQLQQRIQSFFDSF